MKLRDWIEENKESMIQDVNRLVSIASVSSPAEGGYPFGPGCKQVLDQMLAMASSYGFDTCNYEDYCGSAVLKGEREEELGLFSHLDVVPEGSGWTVTSPYTPVIKDGWIYGRGSADNKGPAVAALYAMRYLKEQGIALKHSLRQFYGCDEERGMEDIAYYLTKQKPPKFALVPDAAFPVCCGEKGRIGLTCETDLPGRILSIRGGEGKNAVPSCAKAILEGEFDGPCGDMKITVENGTTRIEASGQAAHSGKPEGGENAISKLAAFLCDSGWLTEDEKKTVRFLGEGFSDFYGSGLHISCEDEISGRLTAVATFLTTENSKLKLFVDLRYPVSGDGRKLEEQFCRAAAGYGWTVSVTEQNPGFYLDKDDNIVGLLTGICKEVYGKEFEPYCMGGGTYARKLPKAVGYGPSLSDQKKPCQEGHGKGHQPDECVCIDNLLNAVEIYVKAILELDKIL